MTPPLFADYAARWESLVLPTLRDSSAASMRSHLRALAAPEALGARPLPSVDWAAVQAVFNTLGRDREPKTLRSYWSTLSLVLGLARQEGWLTEVVPPRLPRVARKPQPFLTVSQASAVLRHLEEPYHTYAWLLAETGARVGETLGIQPQDLDLKHATLHIQRDVYRGAADAVKTDSADRTLSLSLQLVRKLEPLCAGLKTAFLFRTRSGKPWWPTEVARVLDRAMEDAGVPRVSFHAWRRGNITTLSKTLHCPEDIIAGRVGHRPAGITLGVYSQPLPGSDRPWANQLGTILEGQHGGRDGDRGRS